MRSNCDLLAEFAPIGLEDMDAISLMNRIDTKYLTDADTLSVVLEKAAAAGYMVLEMAGLREQDYRSMYYDTPSLQMYLDHHNRRLVRQKLRTRCYLSSGQTFLEVKTKNNHGRTKKKRIEIRPDNYSVASFGGSCSETWLTERLSYPLEGLSPALETVFSRITLVDPGRTERSTIDYGVRFANFRNGNSADLGRLAIIEVKQDGCASSVLRDILLECRVKPFRISKYCIGTALTDLTVRSGRFKQKIRMINKQKYD